MATIKRGEHSSENLRNHAAEFGDKICSKCIRPADIVMWNYADEGEYIFLCRQDALQLARKLLEDLCDLDGDRHG